MRHFGWFESIRPHCLMPPTTHPCPEAVMSLGGPPRDTQLTQPSTGAERRIELSRLLPRKGRDSGVPGGSHPQDKLSNHHACQCLRNRLVSPSWIYSSRLHLTFLVGV